MWNRLSQPRLMHISKHLHYKIKVISIRNSYKLVKLGYVKYKHISLHIVYNSFLKIYFPFRFDQLRHPCYILDLVLFSHILYFPWKLRFKLFCSPSSFTDWCKLLFVIFHFWKVGYGLSMSYRNGTLVRYLYIVWFISEMWNIPFLYG